MFSMYWFTCCRSRKTWRQQTLPVNTVQACTDRWMDPSWKLVKENAQSCIYLYETKVKLAKSCHFGDMVGCWSFVSVFRLFRLTVCCLADRMMSPALLSAALLLLLLLPGGPVAGKLQNSHSFKTFYHPWIQKCLQPWPLRRIQV